MTRNEENREAFWQRDGVWIKHGKGMDKAWIMHEECMKSINPP